MESLYNIQLLNPEELDEDFFSIYGSHFKQCNSPSPFLSPSILKNKIIKHPALFIIVRRAKSKKNCFIQPFIFNPNNRELGLYGEEGADAITLLFTPNLSEREKETILIKVFEKINPKRLFFHKIRQQSENTRILFSVLEKIGFQICSTHYINCPLAVFQINDETGFKKIFNKSNIRNSLNRLKRKNVNFHFETIENKESDDYKAWIRDFMFLHELRWASTHTPSVYRNEIHRNEFTYLVEGGLADNTIVLFSLLINNTRKSLVLSLKEGNRLIYHQIANHIDPKYYKLSLYKILIRHIGEWMRQNEFEILDFGLGHEKYKFEFSNEIEPMVKLYASNRPFWLKTRCFINQVYYKYEKIQESYLSLMDKWHQIQHLLKNYKLRTNLLIRNIKDDPIRFLRKAIVFFLGEKKLYYYAKAEHENKSTILFTPDLYKIFNLYEHEINLTPAARGKYISQVLNNAKVPFALLDQKSIQSIGWVSPPTEIDIIPNEKEITNEPLWIISDCLTAKRMRGRGSYTRLLKEIRKTQSKGFFLINTDAWNIASQKGIKKAGFKLFAIKKRGEIHFI